MSVTIPQLTIEMEEDGTFLLVQEWSGTSDRIQLHPIHIRHLAELAGVVPPLRRTAKNRDGGGVNGPFWNADSHLGHEQMEAVAPLFWNTQQPAMPEMGDEELAHAYFAAP